MVKGKNLFWQIVLLLSLLFILSACENGGYIKGEQANSSIFGLSIITTDAQIYYIPIILDVIGEEEVRGIEYTFSYKVP